MDYFEPGAVESGIRGEGGGEGWGSTDGGGQGRAVGSGKRWVFTIDACCGRGTTVASVVVCDEALHLKGLIPLTHSPKPTSTSNKILLKAKKGRCTKSHAHEPSGGCLTNSECLYVRIAGWQIAMIVE